jgi:hypothetical protein
MKENVKKANEAMLEGDRDAVLRHLEHESSSDHEVAWLRAHAVVSDDERIRQLRALSERSPSVYQKLAEEIVARDDKIEEDLSQPPDYQFWKKPTWQERWQTIKQYRAWFAGGILLVAMIVFAVVLTAAQQEQSTQDLIAMQATQTEQAYFTQQVANYPAGSLRILRTDPRPTRAITFGQQEDNRFVVATPRAAARFVAVQVDFTCSLPLCNRPPEAEIGLLLVNGDVIRYGSNASPFFADEPFVGGIAQNRRTSGWLVFEVPNTSAPDALLVYVNGQERPLVVDWP